MDALWILVDQTPDPPSTVREMANLLLEKRGATPVLSVGKN